MKKKHILEKEELRQAPEGKLWQTWLEGNSASIKIYDEDEPGFTMQAEIHGETASADIYTRKQTGERHPDFLPEISWPLPKPF